MSEATQLCVHCGTRESTGILVHLCDPCFDAWESAIDRDPKAIGTEAVDPSLVYESAGGTVPNDVKAAHIYEHDGDVLIEYEK